MSAIPLRCMVCGHSFEEKEWEVMSYCPKCGSIAVRSSGMGVKV